MSVVLKGNHDFSEGWLAALAGYERDPLMRDAWLSGFDTATAAGTKDSWQEIPEMLCEGMLTIERHPRRSL